MDYSLKQALSNSPESLKFELLLNNNNQGYKFYWLESIMRLLAEKPGALEFSFDELINEMIWLAWRTVTYNHLRLGHGVRGNDENYLEHAVRILYENTRNVLKNREPSKEHLMRLIKDNNLLLKKDKSNLTNYVPYRLIKPFVDPVAQKYIDHKNYKKLISHLEANHQYTGDYFYLIIDADDDLQKRIRLNEDWCSFMLQNYTLIIGWIQYNKAKYIQDRNPGVPGIMDKISPEPDNEHRKLEKVRSLWKTTVSLTGKPLYEIYTGNTLDVDKFALDHFIPRSYISNDEMWNLTPMDKSLNSSKNNKLPNEKYISKLIQYQYYIYDLIFNDTHYSPLLIEHFKKCERDNINATWAIEKLYRKGNSKSQFENIFKENFNNVYVAAKLQDYEIWEF